MSQLVERDAGLLNTREAAQETSGAAPTGGAWSTIFAGKKLKNPHLLAALLAVVADPAALLAFVAEGGDNTVVQRASAVRMSLDQAIARLLNEGLFQRIPDGLLSTAARNERTKNAPIQEFQKGFVELGDLPEGASAAAHVGQLARGFVPGASLPEFGYAASKGDGVGMALAAAAIVPGVGPAAKALGKVSHTAIETAGTLIRHNHTGLVNRFDQVASAVAAIERLDETAPTRAFMSILEKEVKAADAVRGQSGVTGKEAGKAASVLSNVTKNIASLGEVAGTVDELVLHSLADSTLLRMPPAQFRDFVATLKQAGPTSEMKKDIAGLAKKKPVEVKAELAYQFKSFQEGLDQTLKELAADKYNKGLALEFLEQRRKEVHVVLAAHPSMAADPVVQNFLRLIGEKMAQYPA